MRAVTLPIMSLADRIASGSGEFLLFALTPPRAASAGDRAQEIADATVARLRPLDLDGLILYDIDDEATRNPARAPVPVHADAGPGRLPRRSPRDLADAGDRLPRGRQVRARRSLRAWFDGAGSRAGDDGARRSGLERAKAVATSLTQALRRCAAKRTRRLLLGGVAIPERHSRRDDEHLRLLAKQDAGCRFFVTQVVYDINAAKNLVSDYHYECADARHRRRRRSSSRSRSAGR